MPATEGLILNARWRVLYSVALLTGFLTAGFGHDGWPQIITDRHPPQFSIPSAVVLVLILGRLVAVWTRAELLTWPTTTELRRLAKLSLAAAVTVGILIGVALVGSTLLIKTVPGDARGAVGLIIGLALMPLMLPASAGIVLFEWTRGLSDAKGSLKNDRALLTIAAIVGALIVIGIAVSKILFPMDSLTRSQYDGVLPWILFALGLGALIIAARRGDAFPASAVFATTLTTYLVAAIATTLPPLSLITRGRTVLELVEGKGLIGNGAAFALVFAAVPAIILAILDRLGRGRSASVAMRTVAAGAVAVPIASLGVALGPEALDPPRHRLDRVLSDEQLSRQAAHLQRRCAEAGIQVFRIQQGVADIEIRYPSESPGSKPAQALYILPDASRVHDWFQRDHRWYERVVFAVKGERRGYRFDRAYGWFKPVDSTDYFPRYVLTWKSLQTAQEEAEGILGTEMTIFDTQDNSVLARQVFFFKRNNERFGLFQEACGMFKKNESRGAYAYKWASSVLIPSGGTGAP